jgi:phosphinothricin acetyltransferase
MSETARRKGTGRRLYLTLFDLLRRQGYHSAFAGITLQNASSVGLHEAVGFEHLGVYKDVGYKFGSWHAVGWWRLGLSDSRPAPIEPIPFAQLCNDTELGSWLAS